MRSQRHQSRLLPLLAALCLVVSLVLLSYGYLRGSVVDRLQKGRLLEEKEQLQEALDVYQSLTEDLDSTPLLASRFRNEYAEALIGRLRILYQQEEYDQVIELSETAIQEEVPDQAAVYFWSGNAYFLKGVIQDVGEDSFSFYNRAEANYRQALERDTQGRWGIRYNYELVKTVLQQAEKDRNKRPVKIMRPTDAQTKQPVKKVEG